MPKKKPEKTFYWRGKQVSKSTYFRNLRRVEVSKDSAGVKVEQPETQTSSLLPDVVMNDPAARPQEDAAPPSYPPTHHLLTEADAAMIRDLMVMVRNSAGSYNDRVAVAIAPRAFRAICILLDKLGY